MVLDSYAFEVELDPPDFDFSEGGPPRPPYGSRPSFHGCRFHQVARAACTGNAIRRSILHPSITA